MTEEKESEQVNDDDQEKVLTIDEGSPSEKPKRPGRKKRQTSTVSTNDSLESETQPLFEQPVIVEGKRSRKPTSRLELAELSPPRKEFSIPLVNLCEFSRFLRFIFASRRLGSRKSFGRNSIQ